MGYEMMVCSIVKNETTKLLIVVVVDYGGSKDKTKTKREEFHRFDDIDLLDLPSRSLRHLFYLFALSSLHSHSFPAGQRSNQCHQQRNQYKMARM